MMQMLYTCRCEQNLIIKGLKWPFMSGAAPLCHSLVRSLILLVLNRESVPMKLSVSSIIIIQCMVCVCACVCLSFKLSVYTNTSHCRLSTSGWWWPRLCCSLSFQQLILCKRIHLCFFPHPLACIVCISVWMWMYSCTYTCACTMPCVQLPLQLLPKIPFAGYMYV